MNTFLVIRRCSLKISTIRWTYLKLSFYGCIIIILVETLTPWNATEDSLQSISSIPPLPALDPAPSDPPASIIVPTIQPPPPPTTTSDQSVDQSASNSSSPEHLYANISNSKPILDTRTSDEKQDRIRVPVILPPPRRTSVTSPKRNGSSSATDLHIVSPLAVNARSVSGSPTAVTTGAVKSLRPAIPLAVALRESCNAVFHGADAKKCVFKVSGEMVMSFPSNYLGTLATSEPLSFKLGNIESVERLLHNQQLLKK